MRDIYSRKSAGASIFLILLFLLCMASAAILFGRVSAYSSAYIKNVIPLTKSSSSTSVTETTKSQWKSITREGSGNISSETVISSAASSSGNVGAQVPGLNILDNDKVWLSETDVEIFHLSYNSENGVTVKSSDAGKVIAPGTANEYVFTLENTGSVLLDYNMNIEASVAGTELTLPVKVRVWDHNNRYLLGNESNKADLLQLNSVSDNAKLSAGRFAVYTLEWEWPFEGGSDRYDTMLGDLAVDNDIVLTVRIKTYAEYDDEYPVSSDSIGKNTSENENVDSSVESGKHNEKSDNDNYGVSDPTSSQAVFKTGVVLSMIPVVVFAVSLIVMLMTGKPQKDEKDN